MRLAIRRPSPAFIVSIVALVLAMGGSAYALGRNSVGSREIKDNSVRSVDVRNDNLRGRDVRNDSLGGADINESSLGKVPSAHNADSATNAQNAVNAQNSARLQGSAADDLRGAAAFNQNGAVIGSLGAAFVTVASTGITTHHAGLLQASGSAELVGADSDETGQCIILIDGVSSLAYEGDPDDIGTNNQQTIAVNAARDVPAGAHTVALQCRAAVGTVGKDDAAVNAWQT